MVPFPNLLHMDCRTPPPAQTPEKWGGNSQRRRLPGKMKAARQRPTITIWKQRHPHPPRLSLRETPHPLPQKSGRGERVLGPYWACLPGDRDLKRVRCGPAQADYRRDTRGHRRGRRVIGIPNYRAQPSSEVLSRKSASRLRPVLRFVKLCELKTIVLQPSASALFVVSVRTLFAFNAGGRTEPSSAKRRSKAERCAVPR
jgi:hypothetical protein